MNVRIHKKKNGYTIDTEGYRVDTFFVKKDGHYAIWSVESQKAGHCEVYGREAELVKIFDSEGTDKEIMLFCLKNVKKKFKNWCASKEIQFTTIKEDEGDSNILEIPSPLQIK
ncbi:MAG: hypothetical protein PHE59_01225 [Patescibacteria group bacterium]|nr:hypothetical protein [Patescibacteria group bacterium]MDD5535026.1 hypothetical protein [Patescibacteria group bacterium]